MSTPSRDAIESFKSITGASESVALQRLEEYGGNLNAAVSGHFLELERNITNSASSASSRRASVDMIHMNNGPGVGTNGIVSLINAARRFRPSLLLDPNFRRNMINQIGASNFNPHATSPYRGEVTGVPVGFDGGNEHHMHSGARPAIVDPMGSPSYTGEGAYGNVSRDDYRRLNDIESEMMQAAIEASKREFEQSHMVERMDLPGQLQEEDDELARAISLSLKTADEETAIRVMKDHYKQLGIYDSVSRTPATTSADVKMGSISSEELDEAIMLETQLFGQVPESASNLSSHLSQEKGGPGRSVDPGPQALSRPQSSSLMEQRLLRQQQDDEYLASLLADKEKEMNALKKAESHSFKEEESCRRKLGESDKVMAAKEISLPPEPAKDDENVINVLVRMPDGTRHGRCFHKSDKLQILFDFIDTSKVVKPGSYRVVRPYPRRAFDAGDCSLSLEQLGLTGKQEALFLEVI